MKQNKLINKLLKRRGIIFNGENSSNNVFTKVCKGGYIYIFTSLEIAISKRFKKYIFDHLSFTNYDYLLVIDEIHLVEE